MILEIDGASGGVDWITATETKKGEKGRQKEGKLERLYREHERGGLVKRVKFGGYSGLSDVDGLKVGVRTRGNDEDVILTASGARGGGVAREIAEMHGIRVTRLDLQVTIRLSEAREVAKRLREETLEKRECGKKTHNRAMTYYSSDTGDTLYIGKRSSKGKCIRVYDKGAEKGFPPGRVWRFEVEYHRELASEALVAISGKDWSSESVAPVVVSEMAKVGLITQGVSAVETPKPEKSETGSEETIKWLEWCVKPVLVKLARVGLLDEGLAALGLERETIRALSELYGET